MLDWFAGAVASMSAAKDISQSLVTLRDGEMIRSKVFELTNSLMELQQQMMNAQVEQMALVKKVADLESLLKSAEKENNLNERYELHCFEATGGYAYRLKPAHQGNEPNHFLCSRCFESGKRVTMNGQKKLNCPDCKNVVWSQKLDSIYLS